MISGKRRWTEDRARSARNAGRPQAKTPAPLQGAGPGEHSRPTVDGSSAALKEATPAAQPARATDSRIDTTGSGPKLFSINSPRRCSVRCTQAK